MALYSCLQGSVTSASLILIRDSVEYPARHLVAQFLSTWADTHQGYIQALHYCHKLFNTEL